MANQIGTLVKIDRNGTKYYEGMVTCPRCGGRGGADQWQYTGWTCYECGGSGKVFGKWVERTEEYEQKLAAKRAKRAQAKAEEMKAKQAEERDRNLAQSLADNGFGPDGKTYIVLGDSYTRRAEIKAAGGKYDSSLGWHFPTPVGGYELLQADLAEVATVSDWGWITIKADKSVWDDRKRKELRARSGEHESEYVGSAGERLNIEATYTGSASFEVPSYSRWNGTDTKYVHRFRDANGNLLIWSTTSDLSVGMDSKVQLVGTVKDHSEYQGEKQTVLSRCKITRTAS